MGREIYRHEVTILRRARDAGTTGGYGEDAYDVVARASCQVRDETENEYAAAESARVEHVKTFAMRAREVKDDDLIVFRGEAYRVRRVDGVFNLGREIRVRASLSKSKYTVRPRPQSARGYAPPLQAMAVASRPAGDLTVRPIEQGEEGGGDGQIDH